MRAPRKTTKGPLPGQSRWLYSPKVDLTSQVSRAASHRRRIGFTDESSEIHPAKRRRMLNMDETHHYMSNTGETKSPRANVLVDNRLGRSGRRKVENTSHVTGMHWANYGGEVGAGICISLTRAPLKPRTAESVRRGSTASRRRAASSASTSSPR